MGRSISINFGIADISIDRRRLAQGVAQSLGVERLCGFFCAERQECATPSRSFQATDSRLTIFEFPVSNYQLRFIDFAERAGELELALGVGGAAELLEGLA